LALRRRSEAQRVSYE